MLLKGTAAHARSGGDRPSHGHQGGDSSDEQPWMVSGFHSQDGGGSGNWPCRRVRHDRGALRGVTVAPRLTGCRPVDRCIAVVRRLTHPPYTYGASNREHIIDAAADPAEQFREGTAAFAGRSCHVDPVPGPVAD